MGQKREHLYLGHFLAILGDFLQKRCANLPSQGIHSRENGTPPTGVISEVLPRVDLGPGHAGRAKSTLGRASEMAPDGWYTVFSASLDSLGGQDCAPFSAKIAQKCPQWPRGSLAGLLPPPPDLIHYKLFVGGPGTPQTPVFLKPLPFWG